jgi:hypothetical protein
MEFSKRVKKIVRYKPASGESCCSAAWRNHNWIFAQRKNFLLRRSILETVA